MRDSPRPAPTLRAVRIKAQRAIRFAPPAANAVVMADSPPAQPRPGIDYPRTLIEFGEFFPDEKACVAYLERLRWADGFVCPEGHGAPRPGARSGASACARRIDARSLPPRARSSRAHASYALG